MRIIERIVKHGADSVGNITGFDRTQCDGKEMFYTSSEKISVEFQYDFYYKLFHNISFCRLY